MVSDKPMAGLGGSPAHTIGPVHEEPNKPRLPDRFGVYIDCRDEAEQRRLLRDLTALGHRCRAVFA